MSKTATTLLLLLTFALAGSAGAKETDLLASKMELGLGGLINNVSSESPATPLHAERMVLIRNISANMPRYIQAWRSRVIAVDANLDDDCIVDSLSKEVNCTNSATQAAVNSALSGVFSGEVNFTEAP